LPEIDAVMISFVEFYKHPSVYDKAVEQGLHEFIGVPKNVQIYLDNGAFYFLSNGGKVPRKKYEKFVEGAKPDWYAIPQDYIPTPKMNNREQRSCLNRTMQVNREYAYDGYVPVIHISRFLEEYLSLFLENEKLIKKPIVGLGGIVPNLLRAQKALPYQHVLDMVMRVRKELNNHEIHVFGVGGTATLHLAALLGIDSVDSSGWRNRAARGIIQLPGKGDRATANLGNWKIKPLSKDERESLAKCQCPACQQFGIKGFKAKGSKGFNNRATHNLWVLLEEAKQIDHHLTRKTYQTWYKDHVVNSIYRPLIDYVLENQNDKNSTKQ
ncbi:MAG: hypothetical protein AB1750_14730, partial [Chloroflexota bacterium]